MTIKYELLCSAVEKLADKLNEEMPKDFRIDELGLRYPLGAFSDFAKPHS